jgi:hypothetical protein
MKRLQDAAVDDLLEQALKISSTYGLHLPLSIAAIFDTTVNMGPGSSKRFAESSSSELGGSPDTGISEQEWTKKFLEYRMRRVAGLPFIGLKKRVEQYQQLAAQGDWNLESAFAISILKTSPAASTVSD